MYSGDGANPRIGPLPISKGLIYKVPFPRGGICKDYILGKCIFYYFLIFNFYYNAFLGFFFKFEGNIFFYFIFSYSILLEFSGIFYINSYNNFLTSEDKNT